MAAARLLLFCLFGLITSHYLGQAAKQFIHGTPSEDESVKAHLAERVIARGMDPHALVIIGGRTYFFPPEITVTALDAVQVCNDLGMVLASMETEEENTLVMNHILTQELQYGYWTSGNRFHDQWIWSSVGKMISFSGWDFNEPNETGLNDVCVLMHGSTGWADSRCDAMALYICEQI